MLGPKSQIDRKNLAKMTEEFKLMLVQQEVLLAKVLDPARFIKMPVALKKLPMWGE